MAFKQEHQDAPHNPVPAPAPASVVVRVSRKRAPKPSKNSAKRNKKAKIDTSASGDSSKKAPTDVKVKVEEGPSRSLRYTPELENLPPKQRQQNQQNLLQFECAGPVLQDGVREGLRGKLDSVQNTANTFGAYTHPGFRPSSFASSTAPSVSIPASVPLVCLPSVVARQPARLIDPMAIPTNVPSISRRERRAPFVGEMPPFQVSTSATSIVPGPSYTSSGTSGTESVNSMNTTQTVPAMPRRIIADNGLPMLSRPASFVAPVFDWPVPKALALKNPPYVHSSLGYADVSAPRPPVDEPQHNTILYEDSRPQVLPPQHANLHYCYSRPEIQHHGSSQLTHVEQRLQFDGYRPGISFPVDFVRFCNLLGDASLTHHLESLSTADCELPGNRSCPASSDAL